MTKFEEPQNIAELSVKNPPKCYLIMDGQWGSCGKGLLSGILALEKNPDAVVCNFGPNAGHTFIDSKGDKVMTQQLPIGLVNKDALLFIGPGACIDVDILKKEIDKYESEYNIINRLMIHESVAIISQKDKDNEAKLQKISSTKKGVGSANSKKMMRVSEDEEPIIARDCSDLLSIATVIDDQTYHKTLMNCELIQVESAQGFELSLNRSLSYPYTTSKDVTPEQILNDCAIPRRWLDDVYVVIRTFPIRVGNEFDSQGKMVGYSGPVYPDMKELSWDDISERAGQPILEKTTVTQKTRRVFSWSEKQFERMLSSIAPVKIMLNYCNYLEPDAVHYDGLSQENRQFIDQVGETAKKFNSSLEFLGFGPAHNETFSYKNTSLKMKP